MAQAHSRLVDQWLDLKTDETESCLKAETLALPAVESFRLQRQAWVGLKTDALLTPYIELRQIVCAVNPAPHSTFVDLGAAYGRLAFVLNWHFPSVRFVGYELIACRVLEGSRCMARHGLDSNALICADLSNPSFSPIPASHYLIYDYGTREAIEKSLTDLRTIAQRVGITVVGRGRATRDAIERNHPWLSGVVKPVHTPNYSIYRSR